MHGFMKGRSCLTDLISFYDKVSSLVGAENAVDVVCLDCNKAFGTISHRIVLETPLMAWMRVLLAGWKTVCLGG